MTTELEILAEERELMTKSQLKEKKRQGFIPAISYGSGKKNIPIFVKYKNILDITKKATLKGTIFNLKIKDKSYPVIIKEIQKDFVTNLPTHIDFQIISMKEKIEVKIPIKLVGEEEAVKLTGGIVDFPMREVRIKCFPKDIPQNIEINVANLKIGEGVYVKDLNQEKYTILEDQNAIVVHIIAKKVEEVTPTTAETSVTGPKEPEVIAKGKKPEEGVAETGTQKSEEKSSAEKSASKPTK
ncbi:MAG: 50S ribosomal protein L25 [Endomicrobiia bacterium]